MKVSVIMPAYNCGPYLEEAIGSILNQTFTDFELIICDDGSADNSWEVINRFTDSRIRKYQNEKNLGYLQTYNFLLSKAQGDYITCQDADDWSDATRLQKQVEVLDKFSEVSLVGCNGVFYYSAEDIKPCDRFPQGILPSFVEDFPFILAAVMYRREVLQKVKGFHPYFDRLTSMDNYFILSIMKYFRAYHIDEYLYTARFNPTSNSRTYNGIRKLTVHEAYLLLKKQWKETGSDWLMEGREEELKKFESDLAKNRVFISEKFRGFAAYRIDSGKYREAIGFITAAIAKNPFGVMNYRTAFYLFRKVLRLS